MDDIKDIRAVVKKSEEQQQPSIIDPNVPQLKFELDKDKTYTEQAKDLVGVIATQKAVEDEELVRDITETKKEELRTGADANLKEEQAKAKTAEKNLQEANYGVYEGVATYAGVKNHYRKGCRGCCSAFCPFFKSWC
ncbi:MAG: hypothetical protein IKB96_12290 [Prevotella sp.]|nr:hypothetical protein [Prevotella sp.]